MNISLRSTYKKSIFALLVVMSSGLSYSAQPLNKGQLIKGVQTDLKDVHAVLAKVLALPKEIVATELESHEPDVLNQLRAMTQLFLTNMRVIESNTKDAAPQSQIIDRMAAVTIAKPAPSKPKAVSASIAAASQHKTSAEPASASNASKKSAVSMVKAPAKLVTEDMYGYSMGTDTASLAARSPKFDLILKVGNKVKKLLEISVDKPALATYVAPKVIQTEIVILDQWNNVSNNRLEKFIAYLKALNEGKNVTSFYMKFHTGTVGGSAYDAAHAMGIEQLTPLYALLSKLVK